MKAVIQAGGKGTRLRPYTLVLPKPMMPVGDSPVIETLLKWLRKNSVRQAYVTTGHLGKLIKTYCGDGSQWDLEIVYSEEPEPMGTVGALTLLKDQLDERFIMLNGDLITDLSLRQLIASHERSGAAVTVATTKREVKIDLGVLDTDDENTLVSFREKPIYDFSVSMGLYVMEPSVLDYIPTGVPFGFDDLMAEMLSQKQKINTYEHKGLWMDIGRVEDFMKAQEMFQDEATSMLGV